MRATRVNEEQSDEKHQVRLKFKYKDQIKERQFNDREPR